MYLYEMMWILVGVTIGMGLGWWIMKAEHLLKVGWAITNAKGDVLFMTPDRDTSIRAMDKFEDAVRRAPIFIKTFEDRDTPAEP